MFKLYFVFNLVCIYLAIKSAFSAEVPDPNVTGGHYLDLINLVILDLLHRNRKYPTIWLLPAVPMTMLANVLRPCGLDLDLENGL